MLWVRACLHTARTVWPSGLRRWLKAPVRKGVGSNPTAVIILCKDDMHKSRSVNNFLLTLLLAMDGPCGCRARSVKEMVDCIRGVANEIFLFMMVDSVLRDFAKK